MRETLVKYDFSKFQPLKPKLLETVEEMLANDVSKLMNLILREDQSDVVRGGSEDGEWVVAKEKHKYEEIFNTLANKDGKVVGDTARKEMLKSKLPNNVLAKVYKFESFRMWTMTECWIQMSYELASMEYLMNVKLDGYDLPEELPSHLVPL